MLPFSSAPNYGQNFSELISPLSIICVILACYLTSLDTRFLLYKINELNYDPFQPKILNTIAEVLSLQTMGSLSLHVPSMFRIREQKFKNSTICKYFGNYNLAITLCWLNMYKKHPIKFPEHHTSTSLDFLSFIYTLLCSRKVSMAS